MVIQAPVFTSAATATFTTGKSGTFKVAASGYPTPGMGYFGVLPDGLNLVDNGNGTAYPLGHSSSGHRRYLFGGHEGHQLQPDAPPRSSFTLVINQAPSVTSTATTTVNVGQAMNFGVTTSGYPTVALTET